MVEIFIEVFIKLSVIAFVLGLKEISTVLDPLQFVLEFLVKAGRNVIQKLILDYLRFQETINILKDLKKDKIIVNEFNRH